MGKQSLPRNTGRWTGWTFGIHSPERDPEGQRPGCLSPITEDSDRDSGGLSQLSSRLREQVQGNALQQGAGSLSLSILAFVSPRVLWGLKWPRMWMAGAGEAEYGEEGSIL